MGTTPPQHDAAELALELRGIVKRFGAITANDGIDLQLRRGEIHALLGENGAGKSTLMNVVYGMGRPDEGEIRVDGELVQIHSPTEAMARGIGMVFQHFMLIPVMTAAENLVLGAEPKRRGLHRGKTRAWKKAIVELAPGEQIELFEGATSD